jgi:hypothetical protein
MNSWLFKALHSIFEPKIVSIVFLRYNINPAQLEPIIPNAISPWPEGGKLSSALTIGCEPQDIIQNLTIGVYKSLVDGL